MNTGALVSVEEYLHTSYPDGDREYVDGRIVERNMGRSRSRGCSGAGKTNPIPGSRYHVSPGVKTNDKHHYGTASGRG